MKKLKKAYEQNEPLSQMLLQPVHITPYWQRIPVCMDEAAFFEELGFIFDSFGANSSLSDLPPLIDEKMDIRGSFIGILDFVDERIRSR